MIIDAQEIATESTVEADLCIIGGGAAGITIARELARKRIDVCLLESGNFEPDASTQALYEGRSDAALIRAPRADYLRESRLRYFGGTTNHWYGQCLPFDEIDFERRAWVRYSGWPFARAVLDPYYERALAICQITSASHAVRSSSVPPDPLLTLDATQGLSRKPFLFSPPTRFGQVYRTEISSAANVALHLGANVLDIQLHRDGRQVERVRVGTLGGNRFYVRARSYVLASGGIENARLLLNSDGIHANGLGNAHDLVGRFFMEHPWTLYARASYWAPGLHSLIAENLQHGSAAFWPTETTQRQLGILNGVIRLQPASQKEKAAVDGVTVVAHEIDHLLRDAGAENGRELAALFVQVEQSPNPESRVVSTRNRDALGQRMVQLTWRLTRFDHENGERLVELFARALGRQRSGRVQVVVDPADPWAKGHVGWHHVGTTRMSESPRQGVVDANCRVHGVANLYVAGSSVFPTASYINPTLTITALALRLADYLEAQLIA